MNRMLAFCLVCVWMSVHSVVARAQTSSDIPTSSFGDAAAFYDSATGDIFLSLGENLIFVVLSDAPFGFTNGVFDPTLVDGSSALGLRRPSPRQRLASWHRSVM